MITVKGTQTGSESADPAAPYVRKPEEKSGAVAKVSLLLAAVVLYFKAFLTGRAEAAEEAPLDERNEDSAVAPKVTVIAGGKQHQDPGGAGFDRDAVDQLAPATFGFTPNADTIAFANGERQVVSPVFQPAGYIARRRTRTGLRGREAEAFATCPQPPGP